MHRFASIQNVTDRQTDRRHRVAKARPIVRSAKNVGETIYAKGDAIFPVGLHCAYVAHVWRPFSTYRKWNYSPVLRCAGVSWAEMHISGEMVL